MEDLHAGDLIHLVNCSIKSRSTKFGVVIHPSSEWFLYINSYFNENYYGLEIQKSKYPFLNKTIHYIACRNLAVYNLGRLNKISKKHGCLDIEDLNRLDNHINGLRHFGEIEKEKISSSIQTIIAQV